MVLDREKIKKMLDAQGFDPRTSRMRSGRATKCTMHPWLILVEGERLTSSTKSIEAWTTGV